MCLQVVHGPWPLWNHLGAVDFDRWHKKCVGQHLLRWQSEAPNQNNKTWKAATTESTLHRDQHKPRPGASALWLQLWQKRNGISLVRPLFHWLWWMGDNASSTRCSFLFQSIPVVLFSCVPRLPVSVLSCPVVGESLEASTLSHGGVCIQCFANTAQLADLLANNLSAVKQNCGLP